MYLYFPHVYYNNDYFPRRVSSQVMTRFHINNRIFFTSSNGCPLHAAKSWQAIGRGTPLPKKNAITVSNLDKGKSMWGLNANIINRMDEGQISTGQSWDSTASTGSMMLKLWKIWNDVRPLSSVSHPVCVLSVEDEWYGQCQTPSKLLRAKQAHAVSTVIR